MENNKTKKSKDSYVWIYWVIVVVLLFFFTLFKIFDYYTSKIKRNFRNISKRENIAPLIRRSKPREKKDNTTNFIDNKVYKEQARQNFEEEIKSKKFNEIEVPGKTYSVQIVASKTRLHKNAKEFKSIKYNIEEKYDPIQEIYKYKYLVGKETSLTKTKRLQRKLKKLGFKGAFIVKR